MSKPLSISLADLKGQVNIAREATLKIPGFEKSFDDPVFFPDLGLMGYILRDDFAVSSKDLARFTTALKGPLDGIGTPVTIIRDGKILMGYFPVKNVISFQ